MFKLTKTIPLLTEIANREDLTLAEAVVYSALRFKLQLSIKTNFRDNEGRLFIIHQQSEIMADTGLSKRKVIDAMVKLESKEVGLIRREKIGRSFKIYFNEYEVDERYLVAEKPQNELHIDETGVTPNVTPQETTKPVKGQNDPNSGIGDKVVDNLGIVSMVQNPTGAENAPIKKIGAENAPYNKTINNKTINNINNNFTLLKSPKVTIDHDLYTTFTKCFSKAPNVEIKNVINGLINRGVEKDLILDVMQEIGQKGWSWGKALDQINGLVKQGIKTVDQYYDYMIEFDGGRVVTRDSIEERFGPRPEYSDEYIRCMIRPEQSEWDGVDQMVFA